MKKINLEERDQTDDEHEVKQLQDSSVVSSNEANSEDEKKNLGTEKAKLCRRRKQMPKHKSRIKVCRVY